MLITIAVELYVTCLHLTAGYVFMPMDFMEVCVAGEKAPLVTATSLAIFWTHSARALQAHETGGVMLASQGRTSLDALWVDPPTGLQRICCLPAMVMVCCVSVSMEKSVQVRKMRYEGFWEGRPNLSALWAAGAESFSPGCGLRDHSSQALCRRRGCFTGCSMPERRDDRVCRRKLAPKTPHHLGR
jgi:hypothetical protein